MCGKDAETSSLDLRTLQVQKAVCDLWATAQKEIESTLILNVIYDKCMGVTK